MRISDWSSDVCSSDLLLLAALGYLVVKRLLRLREAADRPGAAGCRDEAVAVDPAGEGLDDRPGRRRQRIDVRGLRLVARGRYLDGALLDVDRSEEHTSELQSLMRTSYAVFCLKKKKQRK